MSASPSARQRRTRGNGDADDVRLLDNQRGYATDGAAGSAATSDESAAATRGGNVMCGCEPPWRDRNPQVSDVFARRQHILRVRFRRDVARRVVRFQASSRAFGA
jgi:hypothetical protein